MTVDGDDWHEARMAGYVNADPKPPPRRRGRLPTVAELGGRCQVCGYQGVYLERMHLLRGVLKEDVPELIMVGCGEFGRCRIHPRHTREDTSAAAEEIRAVMTIDQREALARRVGMGGLERLYPERGTL